MTLNSEPAGPRRRAHLDVWVRRGCALIVAAVAAYASYEHQSEFARRGGADPTSAALWPLSVDGLLVLATVGLLTSGQQASRRVRVAVWSSFLLGIAVSLAANIAAAPVLAWHPVLVAGWPPVALLLAVELLAHQPRPRHDTAIEPAASVATRDSESDRESGTVVVSPPAVSLTSRPQAHEIMWAYFLREQARGRIPTGAELDRAAGTNNYGRSVLRQWRQERRIQPAKQKGQRNGHAVSAW